MTTPFTLVRLLSCHCFLFLRLSHLVLDEADWLFTLAPEQVKRLQRAHVEQQIQNSSCWSSKPAGFAGVALALR